MVTEWGGETPTPRYNPSVRRYQGERIDGPTIAVIANDAIGNFVVSTPLLQLLRQELQPKRLVYFSGTRTLEFLAKSDSFDDSYPLHGNAPRAAFEKVLKKDPFDLVISLERTPYAKVVAGALAGDFGFICGPCIDEGGRKDLPFPDDDRGDLWRDEGWAKPDITERYSFLDSGFIGEVFCRLAYLSGPIPNYRVPSEDSSIDPSDVVVSPSASQTTKLWDSECWVRTVNRFLAAGLTVSLVGADKQAQRAHYEGTEIEDRLVEQQRVRDLRGKLSLPQLVGVLARAKLVLSIDNGIMHLGAAAKTPTIGLFRNGIHRLWAPPYPWVKVVEPGEGRPVTSLTAEAVWREVELILQKVGK